MTDGFSLSIETLDRTERDSPPRKNKKMFRNMQHSGGGAARAGAAIACGQNAGAGSRLRASEGDHPFIIG